MQEKSTGKNQYDRDSLWLKKEVREIKSFACSVIK